MTAGPRGRPSSSLQDTRAMRPAPESRRRPPRRRELLLIGVGMLVVGAAVAAGPVLSVLHRAQADSRALHAWNSTAPGGARAACDRIARDGYALLRFNEPASYRYSSVAADGTWSLLDRRSMVHYG